MTTFETAATYTTRSIGDQDCVFSYTVIKRTAKFITVRDCRGEVKRVGVKEYEGREVAYPEGQYSMAPSIKADRKAA